MTATATATTTDILNAFLKECGFNFTSNGFGVLQEITHSTDFVSSITEEQETKLWALATAAHVEEELACMDLA